MIENINLITYFVVVGIALVFCFLVCIDWEGTAYSLIAVIFIWSYVGHLEDNKTNWEKSSGGGSDTSMSDGF